MKTVKTIIFSLFAIGFIVFGLNKFFNFMPAPKDLTPLQIEMFGHFMGIKWLMPLTGFIETLAGVLILIPRLRALGAIVILPVMTGIFLHAATVDPSALPMVLGFTVINIWLIVDNYKKYLPIVA